MEGRDFIPPFVIPPFPRNLDLRDAPLFLAVVFARPAALARRCLHADIEAELSREPPNLREALLAAFALARRKQLLRPRDHRAQLFIGPRLQRASGIAFSAGKSTAYSPFAALLTRHLRARCPISRNGSIDGVMIA